MTIHLCELELGELALDERLLIARALVDSVLAEDAGDGLAPALQAELQARLEDIDSGRVECIPWDAARKHLWNKP